MAEEFHKRGANQIEQAAESGEEDVSTDANGDGTVTVNFAESFVNTDYSVQVTANDSTATPSYTNKTQSSVDIVVDGAGATGSTIQVSWRASGEQGR